MLIMKSYKIYIQRKDRLANLLLHKARAQCVKCLHVLLPIAPSYTHFANIYFIYIYYDVNIGVYPFYIFRNGLKCDMSPSALVMVKAERE